ncbi:hypothetical protein BD779DRAFT_1525190 [Infundibulicybe gibba]|nr:hypothetical protein BD779DRAFT_1525190 [Infundibulicybe gibba]
MPRARAQFLLLFLRLPLDSSPPFSAITTAFSAHGHERFIFIFYPELYEGLFLVYSKESVLADCLIDNFTSRCFVLQEYVDFRVVLFDFVVVERFRGVSF